MTWCNFLTVSEIRRLLLLTSQLKSNLKWCIDYPDWLFQRNFCTCKYCNRVIYFHVLCFFYCQCNTNDAIPHLPTSLHQSYLWFKRVHRCTVCSYHSVNHTQDWANASCTAWGVMILYDLRNHAKIGAIKASQTACTDICLLSEQTFVALIETNATGRKLEIFVQSIMKLSNFHMNWR